MYLLKSLYEENISKESLITELDLLVEEHQISWYCGILHDMDSKPSGEIKKPHYHIIVDVCTSSHHKKDVVKIFEPLYAIAGTELRELYIEPCRSPQAQVRYLTHIDNKEKFQYESYQVFTNDTDLYCEVFEKPIKMSNSDNILLDFINHFVAIYKDGVCTEFDIYQWWKQIGKLDYYMRNERRLNSILHKEGIRVR